MTDPNNPPPPYPGSYEGPPQPQYPTQQYPQSYGQQPYGQPAYPQQQPYGYPPNPYAQQQPGYGYPGVAPVPGSQGPTRPGLVIASSVMAYVNAGLIILAGALLIFGAAIVRDFEDATGSGTDYGTEIAVLGVINLIAAGLLIGGAIAFTGGRSVGRVIESIGNAIVLALVVYWLVRFTDDRFEGAGDGWIVWSVIFGVIAVLSLAFSFTGPINRWLAARRLG